MVTTTHLKLGWLQRNGVAHSDRATMTERFIRHGNHLTVVTIVEDPIYLEEPFVRTTNWVLNPDQEVRRTQFDVVDEVAGRQKGEVPHYLPGSPEAIRKLTEFSAKYKLPAGAARGGAATTYPEFMRSANAPGRGGSSDKPAGAPPERRGGSSDPPDNGTSSGAIQTLHVQGNVHMLVGAGANIIVQAGEEGVLVIDTGPDRAALTFLRRSGGYPRSRSASSSTPTCTPTTAAANEAIAATGKALGGNAPGNSGLALASARVLAHENVLKRMSAPSGEPSPRPFGAWPTETFFGEDKEIFFNDEAIQLIHQPGHTDGDVLVFFRRSDVVASGDLFTTLTYPVIDAQNGGRVQGVIDGLNRLLDITIPKDKEEGGTYVIPGHGRLSDEADVVEFRDMLTIVRDRIQDLDRKRQDTRGGQSHEADARLRRALRRDRRSMDDGDVHRSGVSRSHDQALRPGMGTRTGDWTPHGVRDDT